MKNEGMVDFHAHILPGADHGSHNIETSLSQLELLCRYGVKKVVATPHFYPERDNVELFLKRREESAAILRTEMSESIPQVYEGAEVLVCPGIERMPGLEKLCIKGTDVILLEMPFSGWSSEHIKSVAKISRMGLTAVMAHIDRYPIRDVVRLYEECDVLYQLNGESIASFPGRNKARKLCENLTVAALGSDIHGADKGACKNLLKIYKMLGGCEGEVAERANKLLQNAKPL